MSQRALVLAHRVPYPLDNGWKVRTFHVLRVLAREMPVSLVVYQDEGTEEAVEAFVRHFDHRLTLFPVPAPTRYAWWRVALGALTPLPVHVWNHRSRAFRIAVREACRTTRPTVGVAVCSFMYPFLPTDAGISCRIIDTHNVDSDLIERYLPHTEGRLRRGYSRVTAGKLRHLERKAFSHADQVWVCSQDERDLLESRGLGDAVAVVPNGVDTGYFGQVEATVRRGQLLFFGQLDYFPNADGITFLIDEILPRLETKVGTFTVKIVGGGSTRMIDAVLKRSDRVELIGRVEDLRPWLAESELILVPLRIGSGTRLKVLEAMAAGRPVLSTPIGAEGIRAERGAEILEAEDPETFAREIARVMADPDLGTRVGSRGREAVKREYDWEVIGEKIREQLPGPGDP